MGTTNSYSGESDSSEEYWEETYQSEEESQGKSISYNPAPLELKNVGLESVDDQLLNYEEGPETLQTYQNNCDDEAETQDEQRKPKKSKRIKKVEDYFQWDGIKPKHRDMYYDFVKTAK